MPPLRLLAFSLLGLGTNALVVQNRRSEGGRNESAGPTLFCFSVARPNTHDVETVKVQLLFGMLNRCEAYAVYSNVSSAELLGADVMAKVNLSSDGVAVSGSMEVPLDPQYHSALNAPVFHQVWQQVFKEGTYRRHDWTVKLDPDTVFLPDRLRWVLRQHHVGAYRERGQTHDRLPTAAALGNGGTDCQDMLGAIMVINREAMWVMEMNWHDVLNNNIKREDAMILNFMQWYCRCDEPEPRLLMGLCELSQRVPCQERVAMHPHKTADLMVKSAYALHTCAFPIM